MVLLSIVNNMRTKNWKKEPTKLKKTTEDAAAVSENSRKSSKTRKKIVWLAYQQEIVFNKLKGNAKFIEMVKQFVASKSTITFKINIVKRINKHSKIKNSSLSLHFLKSYFKIIKEICG